MSPNLTHNWPHVVGYTPDTRKAFYLGEKVFLNGLRFVVVEKEHPDEVTLGIDEEQLFILDTGEIIDRDEFSRRVHECLKVTDGGQYGGQYGSSKASTPNTREHTGQPPAA